MAQPVSPTPHLTLRVVASVYDGDTFTLRNGDKVRVTQLDTAEIRGACPREKDLAVEARDLVRLLVQPGIVLRLDHTIGNRSVDRYGRLLRKVQLSDGRDLATVVKSTSSTRYRDVKLGRDYDGKTRRQSWC